MNSRLKTKTEAQLFIELAFKDDLEYLFVIPHVRTLADLSYEDDK